MEYWDAYDKDGHKLKETLVRGEEIPKEVYHLVAEVLVRHTDGDFLLMQRDLKKEIFPGYYEASAGGSALKGETAQEAIIRELREETGIHAFKHLELINTSIYLDSIFKTFYCIVDIDKDSIVLQEGETINYKWLNKDDFLAYSQSDEALAPQIKRLKPFINTL